MLELSKTEIIITFFKFILNFIISKHLNYLLRIQNRNPIYNFKTCKLSLKNQKQKS